MMQSFMEWLGRLLGVITELLDPFHNIQRAITSLIGFFPLPTSETDIVVNKVHLTVLYAVQYINVLNYFVDLKVFYICASIALIIETALLFVRMWRMFRSLFI